MKTSLTAGFAQIFSCYPKNLSCPKFGAAAAPLAPPARTPMLGASALKHQLHLVSSLRASSLGRSIGGEGKGRRACNYISGILIPPPIPRWLPVE